MSATAVSPRRLTVVNFRAADDEVHLIRRAADVLDVPVSQLTRNATLRCAADVLAAHERRQQATSRRPFASTSAAPAGSAAEGELVAS